jgi:hypothetical protein
MDVEKMEREQRTFASYKKLKCHPFIIYYPDDSFYERSKWVAEALIQAYLKLGSWWNFNPQHEISVYLYPEKKFFQVTKSRMDVIGIYDGKIRLLINSCEKVRIQKTAVHEYTHHALADLTHSNIPFWCNEGLAQYVAGEWDKYRAKLFDMAIDRGEMIAFDKMEDEQSGLFDVHERNLAYIQSYMAILFLVDQYGEDIICELIDGLRQGKETSQVLEHITLLNYDEFSQEIRDFFVARQKNRLAQYASLVKNK